LLYTISELESLEVEHRHHVPNRSRCEGGLQHTALSAVGIPFRHEDAITDEVAEDLCWDVRLDERIRIGLDVSQRSRVERHHERPREESHTFECRPEDVADLAKVHACRLIRQFGIAADQR
jgi:hypothetical protein